MNTVKKTTSFEEFIQIDEDMKVLIEEAIEIEEELKYSAPEDNNYTVLEDRLWDKQKEIGWHVIYWQKNSPF